MKHIVDVGVLVCVVAGCGGQSGSPGPSGSHPYSCTITIHDTAASLDASYCYDWGELSVDELFRVSMACTSQLDADAGAFTQTFTFAAASCAREHVLGGCRSATAGHIVTTWFYDDSTLTTDDLKMACANAGGTYVPAP